jgi:hypothetical protein
MRFKIYSGIFALLAIYCAPIGGAFQTRFGPPPPDGFACIVSQFFSHLPQLSKREGEKQVKKNTFNILSFSPFGSE